MEKLCSFYLKDKIKNIWTQNSEYKQTCILTSDSRAGVWVCTLCVRVCTVCCACTVFLCNVCVYSVLCVYCLCTLCVCVCSVCLYCVFVYSVCVLCVLCMYYVFLCNVCVYSVCVLYVYCVCVLFVCVCTVCFCVLCVCALYVLCMCVTSWSFTWTQGCVWSCKSRVWSARDTKTIHTFSGENSIGLIPRDHPDPTTHVVPAGPKANEGSLRCRARLDRIEHHLLWSVTAGRENWEFGRTVLLVIVCRLLLNQY